MQNYIFILSAVRKTLNASWNVRFSEISKSGHGLWISVWTFCVPVALRWLQGTFQLRFHIELHTRKSFRSGSEGMGYKFDMDMGSRISPPISRFLVFFMAYALATDAPAFSNTFSGDRTVSDLSLALISRLSDAQSNIRASPLYCANPLSLFKRTYKKI